MKVIDKIGPDGSVYVCEQDNGLGLVAVFGCKDIFEIGDPLVVNSAFTIVYVYQIHTDIHGFIYQHTDKEGVPRNVLITYSHLLPKREYVISLDYEELQKDSLIHTDKYNEMVKALQKLWSEQSVVGGNDLKKIIERYPLPDEWKF